MSRALSASSYANTSPLRRELDFLPLLQLIIAILRHSEFLPFLGSRGTCEDFKSPFRQLQAIFGLIRVIDFLFHKFAFVSANNQPL